MENNRKVLIVEDDKFLLRAYTTRMKKEGFEILEANDGNEAMEQVKNNTPDVILLDIIMPNKDGFAFLEELRADEEHKDIPVFIISNLGQAADIQRAKDLGIEDYFVKADIAIADVVEVVENFLNA